MKLLLSLSLLSMLASCNSLRNSNCTSFNGNPRPSAELPCKGAPMTNEGLCYVSTIGGQAVKSTVDVVDDTADFTGIVTDRQLRNYTKIGSDAVYRTDDIVYRETNRATDYVMDTYDNGASFAARAIRRYPGWLTSIYRRGANSTRKPVQAAMYAYGDVVDAGIWSTLHIIKPLDPKPYMVGSLNDLDQEYALPGSAWRCRLPQLPAEPVQETSGKNPKNPYTASK